MPVSVLYCEGSSQSLDSRVIRQLVPRTCTVRPVGSRMRIGETILADRTINPNLAGLVDRDFEDPNFNPIQIPIPCELEGIQIGWTWERKEIENYLIDPVVVQRALGRKAPKIEDYQAALDEAAKQVATYTAARMALNRFRFSNRWGDENKAFESKYTFPRRLGRDACEQQIRQRVQNDCGDRIITPETVLAEFERLRLLFSPEGEGFSHYLTFFSGKDLLLAMERSLAEFGFQSYDPIQPSPIAAFFAKVVPRIERAEEVWTWLPEWTALRDLILNTEFSGI